MLSSQPFRPARLLVRLGSLVLTLLALAGQLAAGATVLPTDPPAREPLAAIAAIEALATLCSTGGSHTEPGHAPAHRHAADCALCPLCFASALPGVVLTPSPVLPGRAASVIVRPMLPLGARAPPTAARLTHHPTGPPILA